MLELNAAVTTVLSSYGYGTIGTNLFRLTMPSTPYVSTVVVPTGGFEDVADPTRRPTFTIQHRNTSAASGISIVSSINALLSNSWNLFPGVPGRCAAITEVGAYFMDDNEHYVFPLNFIFYTTKQ